MARNKVYVSDIPELLADWDFEKNDIKPTEVTIGNHMKMWWICSKGHSYQAAISNRASLGRKCPYCARKRVIKGENDLATVNPHLAEEWDYVKNSPLLPSDFLDGSHKKVWWKCKECGHSWQTQIKTRSIGAGCPICGRKKAVLTNSNAKLRGRKKNTKSLENRSLGDLFPELLKEWDYSKNDGIDPFTINIGSGKVYNWKCSKGHEWKMSVVKRTKRHQGCPICSNANRTSFPEQAIFYYISKLYDNVTNRDKSTEYEFDIFVSDKKIAIEYDGYYWHKREFPKKMEKRKNEYCLKNNIILFRVKECIDKNTEAKLNDTIVTYRFTESYKYLDTAIKLLLKAISDKFGIDITFTPNIEEDRGMILKSYEKLVYESSLANYPELLKEWDYEKNVGLLPENLSYGTNKKVYWICPKGHSYYSRVSHRINGIGCPICSHQKIVSGINDLATLKPELAAEWHPTKNGNLLPDQIAVSANKKVWWKCLKCGTEWYATPNKRSNGECGCPKCSKQNKLIKLNQTIISKKGSFADNNPELLDEWDYDRNTVDPKELTTYSEIKVWWICKVCGHKWEAILSNRSNGKGCPVCALKRRTAKIRRSVRQYSLRGEFIKEYPSNAAATRETGINNIYACCKHKLKSSGGYIWRYADEDNENE